MMTEQAPSSLPTMSNNSMPSIVKQQQQKPKRKRRSPAVPWKKPKDMPKRPLSAYNLFFKDERERLVGGGTGTIVRSGVNSTGEAKQQPKKQGIGFANLAKTIAAKWKNLDPISRGPYEEVAGREKSKYDEAVAKWRKEQKVKAEEKANNTKADTLTSASAKEFDEPLPHLPSDRSIGSFSDNSANNPYPNEWFQANNKGHASRTQADAPVPTFVNTGVSSEEPIPMEHNSSSLEHAFHIRQAMENRYGSSFPAQTMAQVPSATALSMFSNIQSEDPMLSSDPASMLNHNNMLRFGQQQSAANGFRNRASSIMLQASLRHLTSNQNVSSLEASSPLDTPFSSPNLSSRPNLAHLAQAYSQQPSQQVQQDMPDRTSSMGNNNNNFGDFRRSGGFGENLHLQAELGHVRPALGVARRGDDLGFPQQAGGMQQQEPLQQLSSQGQQQQQQQEPRRASLRNLQDNLDEETIDFLTSLRYNR